MPAPSTCTVSGTIYGPNGAVVSGVAIRVYVTTAFTDASGNYIPAGLYASTTSDSNGAWSLAVVRTATIEKTVTFRFEYPLNNTQSGHVEYPATIPNSATANFSDIVDVNNNVSLVAATATTDLLPEGVTNLYFTQARVRSSPLTGFVASSGAVAATDTVLEAFQKLSGQAQFGPLTGDVTTASAGTAATTLATVNGNVGSFTNASITVNAKGLVTAASSASTTGSGSTVLATSPTLTTPVIASIVNTGTLTLPSSTDTLVGRDTTDTLTNKTLTSPTIAKLANLTTNGYVKTSSGDGTLSVQTVAIPVTDGGTGQTSFTDGQLLIGNTSGNTLTKATLTAGSGIGLTNGNGSITIATLAPTTSAISASDIDWSTLQHRGGLYTKTLAANTTFTFSNRGTGQTIVVRLTNTASNYTVTWPTVKWAGGTPPTMTVGAKSDVYTFLYDGTDVFGSYVQDMS